MQLHESHRASEGGDCVRYPKLELGRPLLGYGQEGRVQRLDELVDGHLRVPIVALSNADSEQSDGSAPVLFSIEVADVRSRDG